MFRISLTALLLAAVFVPHALGQCASPGADMTAWWDATLDSTDARDLVGNHAAALVNGAQVGSSPGFSTDVFKFDGIDDYVDAGVATVGTTGEFSAEFWVRATSTGTVRGLVAEIGTTSGSVAGQFVVRLLANNSIEFLRRTSTTSATRVVTPPILPVGVWTHVGAAFGGGSDLDIYVNGVPFQGSASTIAYDPSVTGPVATVLGSTAPGLEPFNGEMDEVTLYRRKVPQDQLQDIVFAGNQWKCKTAAPVPAGLLSWWRGDTCGNFASDSAGLNSALFVGNATATTGGIVGDTLSLTNNYLTLGRQIFRSTDPFTVETWVRPTSFAGSGRTVFHETGTGSAAELEGRFMFRLLSSGALSFYRYVGSATTVDNLVAPAVAPLNRWSHIAAVYSGGTDLRLYLDGTLVASNSVPSNATPNTAPTARIGGPGPGASAFIGDMDEFSLYRRALGASEIDAIYRAGRWGKDTSAVPPSACANGSGDDFILETSVNGSGVSGTPSTNVFGDDLLLVTMRSPSGTHDLEPFALLGQLYAAQAPPQGAPGFPELAFDLSSLLVIHDGITSGPFGPAVLPPGGITLALVIPPALSGVRARLQGLLVSDQTNNQIFATTEPFDFLTE